jgi:hypothetical protein
MFSPASSSFSVSDDTTLVSNLDCWGCTCSPRAPAGESDCVRLQGLLKVLSVVRHLKSGDVSMAALTTRPSATPSAQRVDADDVERFNIRIPPEQWDALRGCQGAGRDGLDDLADDDEDRRRPAALPDVYPAWLCALRREWQPPATRAEMWEVIHYFSNKVMYDYFLLPVPTLSIRRPLLIHRHMGQAVLDHVFSRFDAALDADQKPMLTTWPRGTIRFAPEVDLGVAAELQESACPDGVLCFRPDGPYGTKVLPGLVVEVGFSSPLASSRARGMSFPLSGWPVCVCNY